MVTLFEGIVQGALVTSPDDPKVGTISVLLEEPQILVDAILNRVHGLQQVPDIGFKVLVYRTYNNQARIAAVLDDIPAHSPIWKDNTSVSTYFQPGEAAMRATGRATSSIPQSGGLIWCKNSGDVGVYSGSMTQKLSISDSRQAITLQGNNISLATNTSSVATQAFTLSTDLTGLSSSQWGIQNPITGLFVEGISISSGGTINIGTQDPLLGVLTSGVSSSLIPSLLQPAGGVNIIGGLLGAGDISLTALQIAFNGLLSITGDSSIRGLLSITGDTTIQGLLSITGNTSIDGTLSVTGDTSIEGSTTIGGATSITGDLNVAGATTIAGVLTASSGALVTGGINVIGGYSVAGVPGFTGTFAIVGGSVTVANGIIVAVT